MALSALRWPPRGTEPSSLGAYARSVRACPDRGRAALAGAVCALGNAAQFWGGALAGFAAAEVVFALAARSLPRPVPFRNKDRSRPSASRIDRFRRVRS